MYSACLFALNSVNEPEEEPYLTLDEVGATLEHLQKNLTGNVVLWWAECPTCLCHRYADKKQNIIYAIITTLHKNGRLQH